MEKVIRFVEGAHTEKGVSYWKVEFADGDRATAWDKTLIPQLEESIGKSIDLVIKTSPDGKYQNIRGIASPHGSSSSTPAPGSTITVGRGMGKSGSILVETQQGERSINGQSQRPDKDKSIGAWCIAKIVHRNDPEPTVESVIATYKKALKLLG